MTAVTHLAAGVQVSVDGIARQYSERAGKARQAFSYEQMLLPFVAAAAVAAVAAVAA